MLLQLQTISLTIRLMIYTEKAQSQLPENDSFMTTSSCYRTVPSFFYASA